MTVDEFDALPAQARPMPRIPRTGMRSWAARQLSKQGNLCPICGFHIDLKIKGEGVIDHDHVTGEARGVLHRSCNAALGKMDNAIGRWAVKSMNYALIIACLKNVVKYYEAPGTGYMYSLHKTVDERKEAANAKAKLRKAEIKAKLALRATKGTA